MYPLFSRLHTCLIVFVIVIVIVIMIMIVCDCDCNCDCVCDSDGDDDWLIVILILKHATAQVGLVASCCGRDERKVDAVVAAWRVPSLARVWLIS